ncbi:hypothetical protein Tco_0786961 [Tanacetum coccineum]
MLFHHDWIGQPVMPGEYPSWILSRCSAIDRGTPVMSDGFHANISRFCSVACALEWSCDFHDNDLLLEAVKRCSSMKASEIRMHAGIPHATGFNFETLHEIFNGLPFPLLDVVNFHCLTDDTNNSGLSRPKGPRQSMVGTSLYSLVLLLRHETSNSGPDLSFDIPASPKYMSGLGCASLAKIISYVSHLETPEETIPHHVFYLSTPSSYFLAMAKYDMNAYVSDLSEADLGTLIKTYRIPLDLHPRLPDLDLTMDHLPGDAIFYRSGLIYCSGGLSGKYTVLAVCQIVHYASGLSFPTAVCLIRQRFLKIISHSDLGNKPLPISFLGSGLVLVLHSGLPFLSSSGLAVYLSSGLPVVAS